MSAFAAYASNGIVVTTMDFFMHSFKSLVGYHYSITGENYSPSPVDQERQSGNNTFDEFCLHVDG